MAAFAGAHAAAIDNPCRLSYASCAACVLASHCAQVVAELTALDEGLRNERPRSRAAAAAAHAAVSNTRAHSGSPRGAAGPTGSWMLPGVLD